MRFKHALWKLIHIDSAMPDIGPVMYKFTGHYRL